MSESARGWRWWRLLLLALPLPAAALAYFFVQAGSSPSGPANDSAGAALVVCSGFVDTEDGVAELTPLQPGRVVQILVRENQPVSAGTPLLQLDDRPAAIQVELAEAELKSAMARLELARKLPAQHDLDLRAQQQAIDIARARHTAASFLLQRQRGLAKINQLSQEELRAAEEQVRELESAVAAEQYQLAKMKLADPQVQVALAESAVEARQSQLKSAQQALAECWLRAPADGQVLRLLARLGDRAGGAGPPAVLFAPNQPLVIRAELPQEFANRVQPGQPATLQDDARLQDAWTGKVTRLSNWYTQRRSVLQEPLQRNDVRTLECIIQIDPHQPPLKIGQRMRVAIQSQ